MIKVPKFDLIIENYMFLLERERNFLERNEHFIKQKEKLQAVMNEALDQNIDIKRIEELLGGAFLTPSETLKEEEKEDDKKEESDDSDEEKEDESEQASTYKGKALFISPSKGRRNRRTWKELNNKNFERKFNRRRQRMRDTFYNKNQAEDGEGVSLYSRRRNKERFKKPYDKVSQYITGFMNNMISNIEQKIHQ